MFTVLIRTIILYILVITSMRIMGKKQIGELEPFELAITIMISELASLPMQDNRVPLINGIIPIITLILLQVIFSTIQLKSESFRKLVNSTPSVLIRKGKFNIEELKRQQFNINDLMEELRLGGYFNPSDVEYAILETSGKISIIPKIELNPVTKKDMNILSVQDKIPVTIILDGKVNVPNLKLIKKDLNWLKMNINAYNIGNFEDVFIALIDSQGKFYCQANKKI